MSMQFNLEDFFPLYVTEKDTDNFYNIPLEKEEDLFYTSIVRKKEFDDQRPYFGESRPLPGEALRHQKFMQRFMSPYTPYEKVLVYHGLGTGKCHLKDTPIMMYDGSIKKVQEIKEGELLMGDDSTPREVLSTATGEDEMYEIKQNNGDKYVVNSEHILCLKSKIDSLISNKENPPYYARWISKNFELKKKFFESKEEADRYAELLKRRNETLEINVKDFTELSAQKQAYLRGYKVGLEFPERKVEIHPYLVGFWLGQRDLSENAVRIYDMEILEHMNKILKEYDIQIVKYSESKCHHYKNLFRIINTENKRAEENIFKGYLIKNEMLNTRRVPEIYRLNSKEVRYQFLAGLVDGGGYVKNKIFFELIQKEKEFVEEVTYICRSLGIRTCVQYEDNIGKYRIYFNANDIPISRHANITPKELQVENELETIIKVKKLKRDKYYGFMLDKNCRYLLGDFTVTHNTCLMSALTEFAMRVNNGELSINKITILVRNPNLRNNVINEIAKVCTNGKYYPTEEEIERERLSEDAIRRRVLKAIRVNYEVETFTTFVNIIKEMTDTEIKETYSNRYILIDEAHNIRVQPVKTAKDKETGKEAASNYNQIHKMLHLVTGCKVLLLTATPMRDKPSEICQILNLILPMTRQMDRKTFMDNYYGETGNLKESKIPEMKTYLKGIVSYLRSSTSNVRVINAGDVDVNTGMKFTNTYRSKMSDFQTQYYIEAYKKDFKEKGGLNDDIEEDEPTMDTESSSKGIYINSRQASMFVFPDGTYGIQGPEEKNSLNTKINIEEWDDNEIELEIADTNEPKNWLYQDGNIYRPTTRLIKAIQKKGKKVENMLESLKEYSVKFYEVIKSILEHPKEKFFIYSNIVTGSGALLIGALLEIFGLQHIPIPTKTNPVTIDTLPPKDRYVVLTGSTLEAPQTDKVINGIFNRSENKYGEYCRVIVGSHVVGEGISFKHIRKMYVMTPFWNSPTTDQAIGRANRAFSHDDLPVNERTLTVYRMASDPVVLGDGAAVGTEKEKILGIDSYMYKVSEDKDIKIKQIERLLKEGAVDCSLNRERNILESDKPFSKNCDYMEECNYKCDYVNEKYSDVDWVGERIQDTYNLYYAREEIDGVKEIIREAFKYKFAYDFDELYNMITIRITNLSPIVLARALNEMIIYNDLIYNKWGFRNFLREDRNLFFLIDNPFLSSIYTSWYYAANPEPKEQFESFHNIVIYNEYQNMDKTLEYLEKYKKDPIILDTIMNNMSDELHETIIEIFLFAYFNKSKKNKELQEYIYNKYNNYIQKVDNETYLVIDESIKKMDESGWIEASEEDIENIRETQKELVKQLKKTDWGYFGYIGKNTKGEKQFRIKINQRYLEGQEEDKRQEGREGIACGSGYMSLSGLLKLFYDLVSKEDTMGVRAPDFRGKIEFTREKLISNPKFKEYLEEYIILKEIDRDFNALIDKISNQEEEKKIENMKKLNIILFKMFEEATDEEKKLLKKFGTQKEPISKKKEFKFNGEEMKLYVESLGKTKMSLLKKPFNKDIEEYKKEKIESVIRRLTDEQINNLGSILSRKSPEICSTLEEWFEINNLVTFASK